MVMWCPKKDGSIYTELEAGSNSVNFFYKQKMFFQKWAIINANFTTFFRGGWDMKFEKRLRSIFKFAPCLMVVLFLFWGNDPLQNKRIECVMVWKFLLRLWWATSAPLGPIAGGGDRLLGLSGWRPAASFLGFR
jgi:hypothetical protein